MSEVDRSRIEMLREEAERHRANLAEMQKRVSELSATAVSPRKEVSVTVGNQGVIKDLHFPTSAYRKLPKKELADLITDTIAEAREKATAEIAGMVAPNLPAGVDAKAMVNGDISADALVPNESRMPQVFEELRKRRAEIIDRRPER